MGFSHEKKTIQRAWGTPMTMDLTAAVHDQIHPDGHAIQQSEDL